MSSLFKLVQPLKELVVGPCESRLLDLMGARAKAFKRGSGRHTGLFENETCRDWLVLDSRAIAIV